MNSTLLDKHWAIYDDSCYPDDSFHLPAFDVIYCSRAYNFYHGISYIPKGQNTKAYTKEQLRLKEKAEALAKITEIEAQIQAKDIELDRYRGISLFNVQVTHKQYSLGIVIVQNNNTIKVRFPDDLEKNFMIHAKYAARLTFEDDEPIIAAFTEFDRLIKEIQTLQKQLDFAKAKL